MPTFNLPSHSYTIRYKFIQRQEDQIGEQSSSHSCTSNTLLEAKINKKTTKEDHIIHKNASQRKIQNMCSEFQCHSSETVKLFPRDNSQRGNHIKHG